MTKKETIFLSGIGGMGMTSLANLLIKKGYRIIGSDIKESKNTAYLKKRGVKIFIGQKSSNIKNADVFIYSSAIQPDNPELLEAKKRKLLVFNRYEYLMELLKNKKIIAISGTHGKSTTTSMISFVLKKMNQKPTVYIGATSKAFPYGSEWGEGEYAVVETDEHDKSFLLTPSFLPIILNVDNDHLAKDGPYRGKFSLLKQAFKDFEKKSLSGFSLLNIDDPFLKTIKKNSKNQAITFGINNKKADFRADNLKFYSFGHRYLTKGKIYYQKKFISDFFLQLPGKENVLNFLATIAVVKFLSLNILKAIKILRDFEPIKRRFNIFSLANNRIVIDDHADHPTEIKVSLKMIRQSFPNYKILLVLQPHRYSRVSLLYRDYAKSIKECDNLILLPLDPANEKPIAKVSSKKIYEVIIEKKIKKQNQVLYFDREVDKKTLFEILKNIPLKKQVIVFMGPGKISSYALEFLKYIKRDKK